ncbi:MAG: cadherin-like beta sandwich domain-containing protein [Bacilli bacterium]|nr:cadherin-like beta sandwich domain-containing protein [Bacilli bacterium]
MNRIKKMKVKGILVSILAFFMPIFAYAQSQPQVNITGPTAVSPSEEFEYIIYVNGIQATTGTTFTTQISYDSKVFTFKAIKQSGNWENQSEPGISGKDVVFNCKTGNCSNEVGRLVFKVTSKPTANSANLTFNTTQITNAAGDVTQLGTKITKTISIKSSDASLSGIKINGVSVEKFHSENLTYDVSVTGDIANAKIEATTTSSKASFKNGLGPRTVNLEYGNNTIKLNVVSESGTEQIYTLNITREDTRSTDATLSGITIDGTALEEFKSNKYKYTIKKYKAETVKIEAITNDPNAKAEVTGPQKLLVGDNEFKIIVTSEKGEKATYTVIVNNLDKSISKMLKSLSIKGYDISFDKNNYQYKINYNRLKFEDLKIYYTTVSPEDEVTVTMNPDINNNKELIKDLKVGDEIEITITGIDGESSKYTIVIEKDKRVSFFLLLELFLIFAILIVILVLWIKRKKEEKNPKEDKIIEEKVEKKKEEKQLIVEPRRERRRNGEPPVEPDPDPELEATKELTTKELNL